MRGSQMIPLRERLFGVLSLLVHSNGQVVAKETFATVVWTDAVMTDSNLAQHVYQLRRLLRETARDRSYIAAVPGQGYRFTRPVFVERPACTRATSEATAESYTVLLSKGLEPFGYFAQGSYLLEKRSRPGLERAIEFFEAALRIDRAYTPALLGLARAHALLAEYWFVPASPAFKEAKSAVARALDLSPGSSTAHAVLSEILAFSDWDWTGAKREIDVALRLDPASIFAHNNAAWLHICTGSYRQAMIEAQLALMAEPSSLTLLLLLARVFTHAGDYRRAIAILSNLVESDSNFHIARRYRAQAYVLNARPADAIGDLSLLPPEPCADLNGRLPLLARAYADCGDVTRATEIYDVLLRAARTSYVTNWSLAIVASGLGKRSEALAYLQTALELREPTLHLLKSLPWFVSISHFEGFKAILRIVGPSESATFGSATHRDALTPTIESDTSRGHWTSP
jgi:DNA-binding winged helix-turn-helix (wHTH) protein/Tfp pilus assembly protein PilF